MSKTTTSLRAVLGNTFCMYFRAHTFHWNVTGMLFHSMHQYFDGLYNELFLAVDPIAEHIRSLNELAPASIANLVASSDVSYTNAATPGTPKEMIEELLGHNALVLESLYKAHEDASNEKHDGIVNFIEERIDAHAKIGWQLRSHIQD